MQCCMHMPCACICNGSCACSCHTSALSSVLCRSLPAETKDGGGSESGVLSVLLCCNNCHLLTGQGCTMDMKSQAGREVKQQLPCSQHPVLELLATTCKTQTG